MTASTAVALYSPDVLTESFAPRVLSGKFELPVAKLAKTPARMAFRPVSNHLIDETVDYRM